MAPQSHDLHGKTPNGIPVTITEAVTESDYTDSPNGQLTRIRPATVTFDSTPGAPFVEESVTITFDMLNFRAPKTFHPQPDDTPLLTRDDLLFHSSRLPDIDDRLDKIREYRQPLRTATITVTQSVNGPADVQLDHASRSLEPIAWLFAFVQGVFPAPIRARITAVDGECVPWTYERWLTTWRDDIGHAFTGARIDWANDVRVFLDDAYNRFTDRADQYRYRRCISWYLDALLDRMVEGRVASIAAGIEVLAERHAAYTDEPIGGDREPRNTDPDEDAGECDKSDDTKGKTAARIQHLVQELGVDVDDLVAFSESFEENPAAVNEYFYATTRNFVLHNARDTHPFDAVFTDYEAALTLFRRLLFEELTGGVEHDRYTSLSDLSPTDQRFE